jgi:16S rRNA (cytidine1402-2'-O)-methyltransferase
VALELTKRFERVSRGPLSQLAAEYAGGETKGEAVILVAGAEAPEPPSAEDWQAALAEALVDQPLRGAVDAIAERFGLKRKEVYDAALALKAEE